MKYEVKSETTSVCNFVNVVLKLILYKIFYQTSTMQECLYSNKATLGITVTHKLEFLRLILSHALKTINYKLLGFPRVYVHKIAAWKLASYLP